MIPGLTDAEAPAIGAAAAKAGATFSGYVALRLPFAVKSLFEDWLEQNYPEKKNKVLGRVREIRGGKLNDPNFTSRMRGQGIYAEQMAKLFQLARKKSGITERWPKLTIEHFQRPGIDQLRLFWSFASRPFARFQRRHFVIPHNQFRIQSQ